MAVLSEHRRPTLLQLLEKKGPVVYISVNREFILEMNLLYFPFFYRSFYLGISNARCVCRA